MIALASWVFTLRQADQARSDFAATRNDPARLALLTLFGGAGLTAGLMLAAFWH
jgi:hypothetical protein